MSGKKNTTSNRSGGKKASSGKGGASGKVLCNVCGSADHRFLYKIKKNDDSFRVVRCNKCSLSFLSPRIPDDFFDDFYEVEYFTDKKGYRSTGQFEKLKKTPKGFTKNVKLFITKSRKKKKGKYLDVGCASGHYVQIFHDKGWDATGIDISEYSTEFAREVRGLNVLTGDVVTAGLPANNYDIITLLNVIEHLADPKAVVEELSRLLKKNGVLVISTPNSGSFVAKLKKAGWWGYDDEGHIHFFSLTAMNHMVDKMGLEIFALDCVYPYGYSLGDVLKREENKGKRGMRSLEYLLQRRITPVTIRCCKGLTNTLAPGITCFIRKK